LITLRDLRINKIPILEREGWLYQPSLSKIGIFFITPAVFLSAEQKIIKPAPFF